MSHRTDAKPLTVAELAEIRARAEKATPGPWLWDGGVWRCYGAIGSGPDPRVHGYKMLPDSNENGAFIAHSRDDIPRLLATLDSLTVRSSELREPSDEEVERFFAMYSADVRYEPADHPRMIYLLGRALVDFVRNRREAPESPAARSSEITCINCGKASGEHFCHGLDTPGCYSMNYKVEAAEAARKP